MRSTDYVTAVAEALLDTTDPNATDLQAGGQRINGHFHTYEAAKLTNQTGVALVEGDVVAISAAHDAGVVLDDVVGSTRTFAVAAAAVASLAAGEFAGRGHVVGAKATGTIARGQWVRKSATTKTVEDAGVAITSSPPAGAIGFSVKAAAAGLVDLYLLGSTVVSSGTGAYHVVGADCKNNATTPDSQYDLDADVVVLHNPSDGSVVVRRNPGVITNNVATAGPAANGRDQSIAFTASSWVHFYWIWNGTTLATISSLAAPTGSTGPAMPTGYTHWAYGGAVRYNATPVLVRTRIRGSWAFYEVGINILDSTTGAQAEATISVAAQVPPNAVAFSLIFWKTLATGQTIKIRVISGQDYISNAGTALAINVSHPGLCVLPNVGQQFFYIDSQSNPVQAYILGYQNPNGGE